MAKDIRKEFKNKKNKKNKICKSCISEEEKVYRQSFSYTAYFDGSFSFGKVGFGFYIINNHTNIAEHSFCNSYKLHNGSSNIAEYLAYTSLISYISSNFNSKDFLILGDSSLVIRQMSGQCGIRNGLYKPFALKAKELTSFTNNILTFKHIYRQQNELADQLSKCY